MPRKKGKIRLGERHSRILEAVQRFQDENGFPPTVREIRDATSISSTSMVDYYLDQLETQGYIEREKRVSRGIRLLKPLAEVTRLAIEGLRIPIVGRIAAGLPLPVPGSDFAYFDAESALDVPASLLPARDGSGPFYALEVKGDSMIDAMVNDGDIVIIKPASQAQNGEMIAAWLKDREETTLKYFYREGRRVRLQPANPRYKPIYVDDPEQLEIQGKVVMVLRQFESLPA